MVWPRRLTTPSPACSTLIHYYGAYSIRVPPGPVRRALGCELGRPLVYYVVMKNHMFGMYS